MKQCLEYQETEESLIEYEIDTILDLSIFNEIEAIVGRKLLFLEMWLLSEIDFN